MATSSMHAGSFTGRTSSQTYSEPDTQKNNVIEGEYEERNDKH